MFEYTYIRLHVLNQKFLWTNVRIHVGECLTKRWRPPDTSRTQNSAAPELKKSVLERKKWRSSMQKTKKSISAAIYNLVDMSVKRNHQLKNAQQPK